MHAKFGRGPTVVSKRGDTDRQTYEQTDRQTYRKKYSQTYTHTHKGTLQLYIVDGHHIVMYAPC